MYNIDEIYTANVHLMIFHNTTACIQYADMDIFITVRLYMIQHIIYTLYIDMSLTVNHVVFYFNIMFTNSE